MAAKKLQGVITPILTPFNDELSFNARLYLEHAHWLLEHGIHFISPFGTTGEALSMTVEERILAVDALIEGGIDPACLMPGAGLCNLGDTKKLCQHAMQRGCAAVMTLPPFFFKNATDEGLYQYFVRLIEEINYPNLKLCLYHIPPMAGIGFTPELAGRLANEFPDIVVAYKDSSGDFENTKAVIAACPGISVFPGAETFLRAGLENGGAGCISATCNINPQGIRRVYDVAIQAQPGNLDQVDGDMIQIRKRVEGYAAIPAMKGYLARQLNEPLWRNVRPPLLSASEDETDRLSSDLQGQL